MTKPYSSVRCPKCWEKKLFHAAAKHGDNTFTWVRCGGCGWYGKLKAALKDT